MTRIAPIRSNLSFTAEKKEDYKDPLMKWPARGLAYTNELGAAISDIAPKMGTLLWFPAMLYFGADIYDKYKNEKTSYSPDARRGTEQAIFQALASVILPTGAVISGQKIASAMGVIDKKSGLSLQSREEIINFLQEFTSRRNTHKYRNNIDEFKSHFVESLTQNRKKLIKENKIKNPLRLLSDTLFPKRNLSSTAISQEDRVLAYADKHIDEMFEIYNKLIANEKPAQFSNRLWNKFSKLKSKFAENPDYKATFVNDAAESIIRKYQKSKIMNNKMLKTIGGFVALGLAIKPIDSFVEHVVIKKYVQPRLEIIFANKPDKNKFLK